MMSAISFSACVLYTLKKYGRWKYLSEWTFHVERRLRNTWKRGKKEAH